MEQKNLLVKKKSHSKKLDKLFDAGYKYITEDFDKLREEVENDINEGTTA